MAYNELHRVKGVPEYMEDLLIARVALGYSAVQGIVLFQF